MNRQNKPLPDYLAGSQARSRRSSRHPEASCAADSVTVRSAGLAVSIRLRLLLILIFSPSEGEKRTQIMRRLESPNGDWLGGSAPASGAANRALAVGMESRKASPDAETVSSEGVFRGGAG